MTLEQKTKGIRKLPITEMVDCPRYEKNISVRKCAGCKYFEYRDISDYFEKIGCNYGGK